MHLSVRYLSEFHLPDKAIDLVDQACSQARLQSLSNNLQAALIEEVRIGSKEIIAVVAYRCRIPIAKLTDKEGARLLKMESILAQRVKGQEQAISVVSQAIRMARAGLKSPQRPAGVFLFAGATGSGKTELAKALAESLFYDEGKLIRFDMSEYMDEYSITKLIGSPPGYRDHEQGGSLTEKIKSNPYSVVLFDEVEKAHPKILDIFLQIFDEGILTDSRGRKCDFRESIIILTSNLGSGVTKNNLGFGASKSNEEMKLAYNQSIKDAVKKYLRPELIGRLTDVVIFHPLGHTEVRQVIDKFIAGIGKRLKDRNITLTLEDKVYESLLSKGFSEEYGVRPMERLIETVISKPLAEGILKGLYAEGASLVVTVGQNDGFLIKNRQG